MHFRIFLYPMMGFALISLFNACSSAENQQRSDTLKSFASSVAHDLLDRNPATMESSMDRVFSFELNDLARQKLIEKRELPETGLCMTRTLQDEASAKVSNSIQIKNVKIIGPISKPLIPVSVTGTDTTTKSGEIQKVEPFAIKMVCKLPLDNSDNPQIVDVIESTMHLRSISRSQVSRE